MGVESSKFKNKSKNNSRVMRKNSGRQTSQPINNQKGPNIFDDLNGEPDSIVTRPHSKSIKLLNLNKKARSEIINKPQKENFMDLKSFSVQNLVKIENNQNLNQASGDSVETNCCSNKTKDDYNKMLNEELYDDIDDINSFEEEDDRHNEGEEIEEDESEEIDEEKKQKELTVTNNIKAVFIDSKSNSNSNSKEQLEILNEESNRKSSMTEYDYELNFYRNGNDIRQSYLTKLISTRVWTPNMKPKQHNSIIIFDWDDTLLPTSFLTPGGVFDEEMCLPEMEAEKLLSIERCVLQLLTEAVEKGNVYIITNAGRGWVEYSANRFFPSIMHVLEKIKIISARGQYEKIFPGNSRQWKIEAFLNLQKNVNMKLVTNIICIGDSLFEMEAGRILASKFTEAFIKTIKFREAPKLDELIKQLKLVCVQFGSIYSSIKNLTIRVEKKKKEEGI